MILDGKYPEKTAHVADGRRNNDDVARFDAMFTLMSDSAQDKDDDIYNAIKDDKCGTKLSPKVKT